MKTMKVNETFFRRKLLNILIIVLSANALTFLYFLIKFIITLVKNEFHPEFSLSIIKEPVIEFVMSALCMMFAYICFRIRKNIKA